MRINIYLIFFLTSNWICCYVNAAEKFGAPTEEDPKDPKYQKMAEELVRSNLHIDDRILKKIRVDKVTTQLVAGIITRLKFKVFLVNGASTNCNAHILEEQRMYTKMVLYKCDSLFGKKRLSTSPSRPKQPRNPKNPKYHKLAHLALDSFLSTSGRKPFKKEDIQSISVAGAKVQISSRIANFIIFNVNTVNNGRFKCKGVILETPWQTTDTLKVTGMNCNVKKEDEADTSPEMDKTKVGGEENQNPNLLKYKLMAVQSFKKYLTTSIPIIGLHETRIKKLKVTKVTTQIVSGVLTRLDFNVITVSNIRYQCHSEILEQPWLKRKGIEVDCDTLKNDKLESATENSPDSSDEINKHLGGETEQDPSDPMYKQLAKESLERFEGSKTKSRFNIKSLEVTKVTTQVVAGVLTRLDFHVHTAVSNIRYLTDPKNVFTL